MNKLIRLTAVLSSISLFVTGCWDFHEIDNTYYIYSIGIDYQDNHFIVYTQMINLAQLSSPAHAGTLGEQDESWTGVGKGKTILEATTQIQLSLENNVDWGQLNSVVFTERALNHGVKEFFDVILHYHKSRFIQWMFGTDLPLEKVFHTLPIIFRTPYYSILGHPNDYYNHTSYIQPIRFHRLLQLMHEPGKTVLLPKLSVRSHWSGTKGDKIPNLTIDGVFPLQNFQANKKFMLHDLLGLRWLQEDVRHTQLFLRNRRKNVAQLECHVTKPKIKIQFVQNKPKYFIQINPQCSILAMKTPLKEKKLIELIKKTIEEEIYQTYQTGLKHQIDLYSLSYQLYRKYPQQWDKHQKLSASSIHSIQINPKITDSGTRKIKDFSEK